MLNTDWPGYFILILCYYKTEKPVQFYFLALYMDWIPCRINLQVSESCSEGKSHPGSVKVRKASYD